MKVQGGGPLIDRHRRGRGQGLLRPAAEREARRERFARGVVDGERVRHHHRLRRRRGVSRVVPGGETRVVVGRSTSDYLRLRVRLRLRLCLRRCADGHAASRRHRHQVARGEVADVRAPRRARRLQAGERRRRQRRAPGIRHPRGVLVPVAIARVGVFRPRPEARRGRRRGRRVRERVQAPRLARRAAARIHQRSGDVRAPLLPPVEVREVRVVVDVVPRFWFVNERGRQDVLPERPEPREGGAAGDGPASPRPRGRDGTARPRDGLGRGGEQTVLREAQLRVRRGRKRERRLRGGRRNNSASSPRARRGGGRRVRLEVAHMTRRVKRVVSSESFRFLSAQTFSRLSAEPLRRAEERLGNALSRFVVRVIVRVI